MVKRLIIKPVRATGRRLFPDDLDLAVEADGDDLGGFVGGAFFEIGVDDPIDGVDDLEGDVLVEGGRRDRWWSSVCL